jgi:hypothetical protein
MDAMLRPFSTLALPARGVPNKHPTVVVDGARPPTISVLVSLANSQFAKLGNDESMSVLLTV